MAVLVAGSALPAAGSAQQPRQWRWVVALVVVAIGWVAVQLLVVRPSWPLSTDEAVYASQLNAHVPASGWAAVRAWGVPVLVSPVTLLSASVTALRLYLSLLSGVALVAAFWPWFRLIPQPAVPLAALLYAGTWFAVYYGFAAMPNPWVALLAVGALGCLLGLPAAAHPRRRYVLLALLACCLALLRPTDGTAIVAVLGAASLGWRDLRRPGVPLALAAGAALGWLPWLVEAHTRFGGIRARLTASTEATGGAHPSAAVLGYYRAVFEGQPAYFYRGQALAGPAPVRPAVWLAAVGAAALLGLLAARRLHCARPVWLALGTAVATVLPYVLLTYATVRFLLPALALVAIAAGVGLAGLPAMLPRPLRIPAGVVVVVLAAAHVAYGQNVLREVLADRRDATAVPGAVGAAIMALHPGKPCLAQGVPSADYGYAAGCRAGGGHRVQAGEYTKKGWHVLVVTRGERLPAVFHYAAAWRRVRLTGVPGSWYAYVAPNARR